MDLGQNRTVRSSTIVKTLTADEARKKAASVKPRAPTRIPIKHKFTQKELLLDALLTEVSFYFRKIKTHANVHPNSTKYNRRLMRGGFANRRNCQKRLG